MGLARIAAHYAQNRLAGYSPCRALEPFHRSPHLRRFIRGPNQVSKTWAGAAEAWWHATGTHPYLPRPARSGTILAADLENVYPKICAKLRAIEPGHLLDPSTRYVSELEGYRTGSHRGILLRSGCSITFAGGKGEAMSLASGTLGWLWIDEVPKPLHFGEALRSLAVLEAPCWMTLTPIGRPVDWLRAYIEGDPEQGTPPKGDWQTFRLALEMDACTTLDGRRIRTPASIEQQIRDCPPGQEPQRLRGEWEGHSEGRALPAYLEVAHTAPVVELAAEINALLKINSQGFELRLSMDHGQGTGAQVLHLTARYGRMAWVLSERVMPKNSGPQDVAASILEMLSSLGFTAYHVTHAFGDANSAGLLGGGAKYNTFIEAALARALGLSAPPFSIVVPIKRAGSVKAGETAMNTALKETRYKIATECRALRKSLAHYTGKEEDLKHALDSARYGMADVWLTGADFLGAQKLELVL